MHECRCVVVRSGIALRMRRVGLNQPTESSYRPITQAAQAVGVECGNEWQQVQIVRDLKAALAKRKALVETHIVAFPTCPTELPWFSTAYGDDDPPVTLNELTCKAQEFTLRESSNAAKQSKPRSSAAASSKSTLNLDLAQSSQQEMDPAQMFGPLMGRMMGGMMQQMAKMFQGEYVDPTGLAEGFENVGPKKKAQKMLGNAPSAAPAAPLDPSAAPAAPSAVQQSEPVVPALEDKASAAETKSADAEHAVLLDLPDVPPPGKAGILKKPASAKPKAKAQNVAKSQAKAIAKASVAKSSAKSHTLKPKEIFKCKKGWKLEIRTRPSGQKDKHYVSPGGKSYRIHADADAAGFEG